MEDRVRGQNSKSVRRQRRNVARLDAGREPKQTVPRVKSQVGKGLRASKIQGAAARLVWADRRD
jgi:hypothetical protein